MFSAFTHYYGLTTDMPICGWQCITDSSSYRTFGEILLFNVGCQIVNRWPESKTCQVLEKIVTHILVVFTPSGIITSFEDWKLVILFYGT